MFCSGLVSERVAWLVQMVRIHSWGTVQIQTSLGSLTKTSEMGANVTFEPLLTCPSPLLTSQQSATLNLHPQLLSSFSINHKTSWAELSLFRGKLITIYISVWASVEGEMREIKVVELKWFCFTVPPGFNSLLISVRAALSLKPLHAGTSKTLSCVRIFA